MVEIKIIINYFYYDIKRLHFLLEHYFGQKLKDKQIALLEQ